MHLHLPAKVMTHCQTMILLVEEQKLVVVYFLMKVGTTVRAGDFLGHHQKLRAKRFHHLQSHRVAHYSAIRMVLMEILAVEVYSIKWFHNIAEMCSYILCAWHHSMRG